MKGATLAAPRVLAIDDDPQILRLVSRILAGAGFDVVGTAERAEEGARNASTLQPEVIVLDFELADTTASELAPRLRAACSETKIVGLSSIDPPDRGWCDAFLLKRQIGELASVIEKVTANLEA